jgi:NAD(P)-dependent dehydrogenase (short-subunit alcohol dehydrogenase family)
MLMTVIGRDPGASFYGELAGSRVLITGLSSACGVDVARAFADHHGRLILDTVGSTPESDALAAHLAETASEISIFTDACADCEAAVRFARTAAQTYGGLDAVINLIPITADELKGSASLEDIEDFISHKLAVPLTVSRIVANRMRTLLTQGLVLNVMTMPAPRDAAEAALAGVARSALAAITRGEANKWAPHSIRVNAIGPSETMAETDACLASEPDIAALALYLASKRGRTLSGHIFDAAGIAARRC